MKERVCGERKYGNTVREESCYFRSYGVEGFVWFRCYVNSCKQVALLICDYKIYVFIYISLRVSVIFISTSRHK